MRILLKDPIIVTQNPQREIIKADILIEDGKITEIKKKIEEKAEEVLECKGKIIFPGFFNTHTHVAMTLFRGYGEGLPLDKWLKEKIWPAEAKLTGKHLYYASLLGIAEMIQSGVVAFNDMYVGDVWEIAKAARDVHVYAIIGKGMFDLITKLPPEEELKGALEASKKVEEYATPSICCHAPYSCSEELIVKAKEEARKRGWIFHIHVSETEWEVKEIKNKTGKRVVEYLYSLNVLDENSLLAHCVHVNEKEIKILKETKSVVLHNPISNMKLASGISPTAEMEKEGVMITLATDGVASNNSFNFFEEMKVASLLQKVKKGDASLLPPQVVFDWATINGAKALNLNAGSIEPGKDATLVILTPEFNMLPSTDIVANIVYSASPLNVESVMIKGKWVMKEKKVSLPISREELNEKIEELANEILQ